MSPSNIPVLIPVTFLLASILIPMLGYFRRSWSFYPALAGSVLSVCFSVSGMQKALEHGQLSYHLGGWMPPMGIEFILDPLSSFMCLLITFIALLVIIYSKPSVLAETPDKVLSFYSLAMLLLAGLSGMVLTGDFFNLYVFLEISALSGYALMAIGDKRAPFSAFRYLMLGTTGATFYLMGLAFIFISTGTLNMADVSQVLPMVQETRPVVVGLTLIILGVCVKMGMFPIHHWLPDAYAHASSTATGLIAPIGTKVAAYVLIRVLIVCEFPPLIYALSWLAVLSIIAGSILAITQANIKRMLAYSSVANIGYITLGITLANPLAFAGAMLHILNHALMNVVLFLAAGGILNKMGNLNMGRLRGFPTVMPLTALAFIIAVLSMVGIPPTGGFFSKLYLILGAVEAEAWFFVFAILLSTLLAVVYLFRFINIAFFRPYEKIDDKKVLQADDLRLPSPIKTEDKSEKGFEYNPRNEMGWMMLLPVLIASGFIILVGFYTGVIVDKVINPAIPEFIKIIQ